MQGSNTESRSQLTPGDEIPASEAIASLATETKADVLDAFAAAWNDAGFDLDYGLSTDELRARVDPSESTDFEAQLDDLTDHFLRPTDEGYKLRYLGWQIVRNLVKSPITDMTDAEPFRFDSECHFCGANELVGYYENKWLWIDCASCDRHVNSIEQPPLVVDGRDLDELLAQADVRQRRRELQMVDGVCPSCYGDMPVSVDTFTWSSITFERFKYQCYDCDRMYVPPLAWHLYDHDAVRSFYGERGRDLEAEYFWEFGPLVSEQYERVRSDDPWRVEIRFPCDGDELQVVLDEHQHVVDVTENT